MVPVEAEGEGEVTPTSFSATIVPAITVDVAVQMKAFSLASIQDVPFHSLSSNVMDSPAAMSCSATKARLSLPSALNPTKAIDPGPSAMAHFSCFADFEKKWTRVLQRGLAAPLVGGQLIERL